MELTPQSYGWIAHDKELLQLLLEDLSLLLGLRNFAHQVLHPALAAAWLMHLSSPTLLWCSALPSIVLTGGEHWDVWCSTVPMQPPIQSMVFEYSYTRSLELSKEIKQSNFTRYVGMLNWTRYFNLCKKLFFKLLLQFLVILNHRHSNIMWMINNTTMCLPWSKTSNYVIFYQS